MTAAELQTEFRRLRDEDRETGHKRSATLTAYNAWFRQACAEGDPPDALRPNVGTDEERFFARTIPGADGHTYWFSTNLRFPLNAGGERHPRWWWYERIHGEQGRGRLGPVCGEPNCITPEHQRFITWADVKRRYSDEQMIGALQTVSLRLGHSPTLKEYRRLRRVPSYAVIQVRFGGWANAIRSAGLERTPVQIHKRGPEDCIAALHHLARHLGHAPSDKEFRANTETLRDADLPTSTATIRTHLGRPWIVALQKAGLA